MACVVLPSETARLVYGYLVKEKLDSIALQFLENSPYLTDCYNIVKSGYHFNTKFLYRELHELIQEYYTIQNSVNKKVGQLQKTSPLYRKIKLQCDTISEIVDLLLFWKLNIKKNDRATKAKSNSIKSSCQMSNDVENKKEINILHSENCDSLCPEIIDTGSQEKDENEVKKGVDLTIDNDEACSTNASNNDNGLDEMQSNSMVETATEVEAELRDMCITSERTNVDDSLETNENLNSNITTTSATSIAFTTTVATTTTSTTSANATTTSSNNTTTTITNNNNNNNDNSIEISFDVSQNDLGRTNSFEIQNENNSETNLDDGQIKILRVENETEINVGKTALTNTFSQPLDLLGSSMSIENSQILFVTPDLGNLTTNQDENQIIVIPIDCYKSQSTHQSELGVGSNEIQIQKLVVDGGTNIGINELISQDVVAVSSSDTVLSSAPSTFNNAVARKSYVDDGIITEGTFLQNRDIIYELESKVRPQIFPENNLITSNVATRPKVCKPRERQSIKKSRPHKQYRRILPRKPKQVEMHPVIIVQPLVECNNGDTGCKKRVVDSKSMADSKRPGMMKESTTAVIGSQDQDPVCIGLEAENNSACDTGKEPEKRIAEPLSSEKISEEKENFMSKEKKTETPVIVVSKNCKRLSLSTPRRKSHIRALEFETPPKSSNGKKKSRTSPKVKVEEIKVKNQSVRNTLFKSPDSDIPFKTPSCLESEKQEISTVPIANDLKNTDTKLSPKPLDGGSQCVIAADTSQTLTDNNCKNGNDGNLEKCQVSKKSWDSDLRCFIACGTGSSIINDSINGALNKKKRVRKNKKTPRDEKKTAKKNNLPPSRCKTPMVSPSPSKLSLTAKRNTYSISGNEEGSPVRSLLEELDLVTPFKDPEPTRSIEETPLTKLLRENINGIDIDLSMITTPVFPPTPSIIITPDVDDSSGLPSTFYYSPRKENGKEKVMKIETNSNELLKIEDYVQSDSEQSRKKGAKETQEKVIGELVSKAREMAGLIEGSEENVVKKPLSGKVLSMVKIQMITQCDKKLYENIPINEDAGFNAGELEEVNEEPEKFDLKNELEIKRKRALEKIKTVKENLVIQTRKKVSRPAVKRKRNDEAAKCTKKSKRDGSNESNASDCNESESILSDDKNESSGNIAGGSLPCHSTPTSDKISTPAFLSDDSSEVIDGHLLNEIRKEFPSFQDDGEYPELPLKTRKKLYYIRHFLKTEVIVRYFENVKARKKPKLELKTSHKKFFQVFYKWLKHPHTREVNTSEKTKAMFKNYRHIFETIRKGVSRKDKVNNRESCMDDGVENGTSLNQKCYRSRLSDDEGALKLQRNGNGKDDEVDDGPVSTLPLKKRKAPVHPVEANEDSSSGKTRLIEKLSRTPNFPQDIDVDRFLFHVHSQENR